MQQRDGAKWVKISDWIEPMKDKVQPLLKKAAADYIQKNTGWPKRTEACDKSSRRRHQGYHFIRRRRGATSLAQRTGAARLHPGDGRPSLLRPSHYRGEFAYRRPHPARRIGNHKARSGYGL
jgi:hypothetical protein